jgi:hypothetical protein
MLASRLANEVMIPSLTGLPMFDMKAKLAMRKLATLINERGESAARCK